MFIVMRMQAASEHLGLSGAQWWLQSMDIWSPPGGAWEISGIGFIMRICSYNEFRKKYWPNFSLRVFHPHTSSSSLSIHNNYFAALFSSDFDTCVWKWLMPKRTKGKSTKGTRLRRKSSPTLTRPSMGALELCHSRRKEGEVLQSFKFPPSKFNQMLEPIATSISENYHLPL